MPTRASDAPGRVALAIGPEVPRGDFGFRVHSVFDRALNLRPGDGRTLVTLLGEDADDFPQGIRLAAAVAFTAWRVAPGDRGCRAGDRLVFERGGGADARVVDLSRAARTPRREIPRIDPGQAATAVRIDACVRDLSARQEYDGAALRMSQLLGGEAPAGVLAGRLAGGARELAARMGAADAPGALAAAAGLVGLGTGLTPSGDDFLCGALAGVRACADPAGPSGRFAAAWSEGLRPMLHSTNAVSATFLACAIAGSFWGRLVDLAEVIAGHQPVPAARQALHSMCVLGHSSGMDTATGFLFGLRAGSGWETRGYAA